MTILNFVVAECALLSSTSHFVVNFVSSDFGHTFLGTLEQRETRGCTMLVGLHSNVGMRYRD